MICLIILVGTVSRPPDLSRGVVGCASGINNSGINNSGINNSNSGGGGKKCPEAIFDINTRLESLALSMTEHALSGPDNADRNAPL